MIKRIFTDQQTYYRVVKGRGANRTHIGLPIYRESKGEVASIKLRKAWWIERVRDGERCRWVPFILLDVQLFSLMADS